MAERDLDINLKLDRRQAEQSAQAFHQGERRRTGETTADWQRLGAATASWQRMSRDATGQLTALGQEGKKSADVTRTGFEALHGTIDKGATSLRSMVASYIGLQGAIGLATGLAQALEAVRDRQMEAAKAASDYEKSLGEIAALQGKEQAREAVPSQLKFQMETRLPAEKAAEFVKQFYGAVPAAIEKGNIDEATAAQLATAAGQMTARQQAAPGPRAELAGLLGMFGKIAPGQAGVRQGLGQLEAIRLGLTAGRGEDEPLTRELLGVAGSMVRAGGPLPSLPELSALVGVTSLAGGPGRAGERVEQLVRGLMGTTPKQMKFLQGLGIEEHMNLEERLDVLVPQLREVGKTRDIRTYLTQAGMNAEQVRAIEETLPNYEILKGRFDLARGGAAGGGEAVERANQEFMRSRLGREMQVANQQQAAQVLTGEQFRDIRTIFGAEEAEWVANKMDVRRDVGAGTFLEGLIQTPLSVLTGQGFAGGPAALGRRTRIEEAAMSQLIGQAAEMGIDTVKVGAEAGGSFIEQGQAFIEAIKEKGGDPFAGYDKGTIARLIERQNELLEEQNAIMKQDQKPRDPALPGKPQPIPSRP